MQEQMKVVRVTRRHARAEVGGGGGESTISHLNKATVGVFQQVKRFLASKKFDSGDKLDSVEKWLTSRAAEFYQRGIQNLVPRYKCLSVDGGYVGMMTMLCRIR